MHSKPNDSDTDKGAVVVMEEIRFGGPVRAAPPAKTPVERATPKDIEMGEINQNKSQVVSVKNQSVADKSAGVRSQVSHKSVKSIKSNKSKIISER